MIKRFGQLIVLISIFLGCASREVNLKPIDTEAMQVLWISDIHFNPLENENLLNDLVKSNAEKWESIFENSTEKRLSKIGEDTNYFLLKSSLLAMKKWSRPKYVIITGDFMVHKMREHYQKITGNKKDDDFRLFFEQTQAFVAQQIQRAFPEAQFIPALGNNDFPCGNYSSQPGELFLTKFSKFWKNVPDSKLTNNFANEFPKYGYYQTSISAENSDHHIDLLVLNDDYWMERYDNKCGNRSDQPGQQELNWLRQVLTQQNNAKWILSHSPIGIDMAATAIANIDLCSTQKAVSFYHTDDTKQLVSILKENGKDLQFWLAGHTHSREFHIVPRGSSQTIQLVTPSIGMNHHNNSAFQVLYLDKNSLAVKDTKVFALQGEDWRQQESLLEAFNIPEIGSVNFKQLVDRLTKDEKGKEKYAKLLVTKSNEPAIAMKNSKAYFCATENLEKESFLKCACEEKAGK